jgi:hypothetical protein
MVMPATSRMQSAAKMPSSQTRVRGRRISDDEIQALVIRVRPKESPNGVGPATGSRR